MTKKLKFSPPFRMLPISHPKSQYCHQSQCFNRSPLVSRVRSLIGALFLLSLSFLYRNVSRFTWSVHWFVPFYPPNIFKNPHTTERESLFTRIFHSKTLCLPGWWCADARFYLLNDSIFYSPRCCWINSALPIQERYFLVRWLKKSHNVCGCELFFQFTREKNHRKIAFVSGWKTRSRKIFWVPQWQQSPANHH